VRADGRYVLYWMIAARRTRSSFGLQRAVDMAADLHRPLIVLEPLRCGYRWASDRFHRFAIDGMVVNARRLEGTGATYRPYVEPEPGAGRGLLETLAARACVVVTDDFPCFFLPRMVDAAEARIPVRLERIDSNGLFPMRATDKVFTAAHSFRRFLQRALPEHLEAAPAIDPLAGVRLPGLGALDPAIDRRWPAASPGELDPSSLPIDHSVGPVSLEGGADAGESRWRRFLAERLDAYPEGRNHPDEDATSGLSPYLHFGHISAHDVFRDLVAREGWRPDRLGAVTGSREGWWGMSAAAEAFLDQIVTWRELGFNRCALTDDYDRYDSLPSWARDTLETHAADPRPWLYDADRLARADTHDEVWNAAQRQLLREGRIHNYLRMLWGKRILEWSPTPRDAAEVMVELNDRYAVDGRDPNSYSGIFWTLGRYDRAWGPERPIFGKVRYMSSANTERKLRLGAYLERFGR